MSDSNTHTEYFGNDADDVFYTCEPGIFYYLYGEGGDDTIRISESRKGVSLHGGDGDDWLEVNVYTRADGYNFVYGDAGHDTLVGGASQDDFMLDPGSLTDVVMDHTIGDGDWIWAEGSYKLVAGANVENLWLRGTGHFKGTGDARDNWVSGNDGRNLLKGGAGNDTLDGGKAMDTLVGGSGADVLIADVGKRTIFDYNRSSESTAASLDEIRFLDGNDRIDLSGIDADASTGAVNEAFIFIGTEPFAADATGQIRYEVIDATHTMVYISVDEDADAEMQIQLYASTLPLADTFIL